MTYYVAGSNVPGYLPESDPTAFETFEEAQQFMIGELDSFADSLCQSDDEDTRAKGDDYDEAMQALNLESGPDWLVYLPSQANSLHDLGIAWWITCEDGPMPEGEDW